MDAEIAMALNELSRRIFECEKTINDYADMIHAQSATNIDTNIGGIKDLADVISTHDGAIGDLAIEVAKLESENATTTSDTTK